MKQGIFFSILICAFLLFFIGCSSSGGGGGDVENDDGGGVGKGEDNVTIFWQEFGRPISAWRSLSSRLPTVDSSWRDISDR
jgi:hypothetical protein